MNTNSHTVRCQIRNIDSLGLELVEQLQDTLEFGTGP